MASFVASLGETESKARDKHFFYCKILKAIVLISLCLISNANSSSSHFIHDSFNLEDSQ